MSFWKKLFGGSKEETPAQEVNVNTVPESNDFFVSPIAGEIKPLSEVPDPVFAEKMMGDGFAIVPSKGEVVSPVDGKIVNIFPTKHAIGIQSNDGKEVLIHFGLETVKLNGEGFTAHVEADQTVKKGQVLLTVDMDFISKNAKSTITPVIFTNLTGETVTLLKTGSVESGEANIVSVK